MTTPWWKYAVLIALRVPLERLRWHPLWLGVALLLGAILSGFGRGFGIPGLFWHDDGTTQFFAGVGVGVLLCELCFVSFLLDSDERWLDDIFPGNDPYELPKYIHSLLWPLVAITVVPGVVKDWQNRWILPLGVLSGVAISLFIGLLLRLVSDRMDRAGWLGWVQWVLFNPPQQTDREEAKRWQVMRWIFTRMRKKDIEAPRWLYAMASGYVMVLVAAYLFLYTRSEVVSPALAICILLGLLVRAYGLIVFHFEGMFYYVVTAIVVWCLWVNSQADDKHRIAGLSYRGREPLSPLLTPEKRTESVPAAGAQSSDSASARDSEQRVEGSGTAAFTEAREPADAATFPRLDDERVLREGWRAQFIEGRPKLVIVTTSGGGIRAAVWTTAVLAALEGRRELSDFSRHVRLVTGASGGVLGAAYYVSTLSAKPGGGHCVSDCDTPISSDELINRVARDSLSAAARSIVFRDVWKVFWPWLPGDRGEEMEAAWERSLEDAHGHSPLRSPIASLAAGEAAGWRPSLVFAPFIVEGGRRLLISNLNLDDLTFTAGRMITPDMAQSPGDGADPVYSVSAHEFARLFPQATQFKISTAARLSASFPYVTPAAQLPVEPPRRIVDAGYYDNYGVNLAALWLYKHGYWLRHEANLSGVLLVQIRDRAMDHATGTQDHPHSRLGSLLGRGGSGLITPIEGAASAYEAMNWFRNNEQIESISHWLNDAERPHFFTTVAFEYSDPAPLSWYLPEADMRAIKGNMSTQLNAKRLDRLAEWWQQDHSADRQP